MGGCADGGLGLGAMARNGRAGLEYWRCADEAEETRFAVDLLELGSGLRDEVDAVLSDFEDLLPEGMLAWKFENTMLVCDQNFELISGGLLELNRFLGG